jgi:hypothetical protein
MSEKEKKACPSKVAGEAAEMEFMARAAALGFGISKPLGESRPYDVIVEVNRRLLRIQVKSTNCERARKSFQFVTVRQGRLWRPYQPDEVDFIAAYVLPVNAWYIVPVSAMRDRLTLNVHPFTGTGRYEQFRERWDLLLSAQVGDEKHGANVGASGVCSGVR